MYCISSINIIMLNVKFMAQIFEIFSLSLY